MKFTPLKFQASLAAGGITLMAFNFLQFAIPYGKGSITLANIPWSKLTIEQTGAYLFLIGIMLAFSVLSLILTVIFIKGLIKWYFNKDEYNSFMSNPLTNIGIFAPISSLAMTVNVIWGPMSFFITGLSANIQAMMLPSLIFFAVLCMIFITLEFKVLKVWLSQPIEVNKLNFTWLLDIFAAGLLSLTGTGIAALSDNREIASLAAFGSLFALSIGFLFFLAKLAYLIYLQFKAVKLPDTPILPAYFLVIPITCLFGISFYRIMIYLETYFSFEVRVPSFLFITLAYTITVAWGLFTVYLLSDYFKKEFYKSKFSATQWGMV